DGVETDTAAQTGTIPVADTNHIAIGGNSPSGDRLVGLIDTVRVWRVALSASELCAIGGACP
ncbi:MAG: hypothetical protein OXR73_18415, partial [Myxococcales bacterium]|nr:hypothetical protein [Myxococcales bacterium]